MRNRVVRYVFLVLIFLSYIASSQHKNKKSDSLNYLVKISAADTNRVNLLLKLTTAYMLEHDLSNAKLTARTALDLAQTLKFKFGIAKSYFSMSVSEKGDDKLSLEHALKALEIVEGENYPAFKGSLHKSIGMIHFNHENFDLAQSHFEKALAFVKESKDSIKIAEVLANLGITCHSEKDWPKALYYHAEALKIFERYNRKGAIAKTYGNIGEVYLRMKDYVKAAESYKASVALFKELEVEEGVALRTASLGKAYFKSGKTNEAIQCYTLAYELALKTKYTLAITESLEGLTQYYAHAKNYEKAFAYQTFYFHLKDSIDNASKLASVSDMQFKFESQQREKINKIEQEKEELKHQEEIKRRNIFIASAGFGFVLMIVIAAISFRAYKQKQKDNVLISEQKAMVEEKQKEILDSIHYARRIQRALITPEKYIDKNLKRLQNPDV